MDLKSQTIVNKRLDRVQSGNLGDWKPEGRVKAFRFHYRGYRIYFEKVDETIVILRGGDKSTQEQDIEKAEQHWIDYEERESTD